MLVDSIQDLTLSDDIPIMCEYPAEPIVAREGLCELCAFEESLTSVSYLTNRTSLVVYSEECQSALSTKRKTVLTRGFRKSWSGGNNLLIVTGEFWVCYQCPAPWLSWVSDTTLSNNVWVTTVIQVLTPVGSWFELERTDYKIMNIKQW